MVYLLIEEIFSIDQFDYTVGVFNSKELAEQAFIKYKEDNPYAYDVRIEEWKLNTIKQYR